MPSTKSYFLKIVYFKFSYLCPFAESKKNPTLLTAPPRGPAVNLRQSERWWGSQWGARLPSRPVHLHTGPEVGGSLRDNHTISTLLLAWRISVLLIFIPLVGFRCQYVTACCCSPNVSIPADWRSLFNRQECHRGRASAAHLCQRAEWYQQSPTLCPSCSFQYSVLSAANDGYELKEEITVFNILREEQNKQNPSKTFYSVHTKQTKKKNKGTKSTSQHICN